MSNMSAIFRSNPESARAACQGIPLTNARQLLQLTKVPAARLQNTAELFLAYVFHDKIVLNCSAAAIQASGAPMPVAAATVVPTQMVMAVVADTAPAAPASTSQKSIVDEIKDLAQMKADGLLSEDEFTAAKAKLMAGNKW